MNVFRWNKKSEDEDDVEMVDAHEVQTTTHGNNNSNNGDSRRNKRKDKRRGGFQQATAISYDDSATPDSEKASPAEPPARESPRLEIELGAMAERLQEIVSTITRERETQSEKISDLTRELKRTHEVESGRAQTLESEVEQLRSELGAKETALRAERENSEQYRRRLEGFEGLKRTMANL